MRVAGYNDGGGENHLTSKTGTQVPTFELWEFFFFLLLPSISFGTELKRRKSESLLNGTMCFPPTLTAASTKGDNFAFGGLLQENGDPLATTTGEIERRMGKIRPARSL